MPIIPRANPEQLNQLAPLPKVRNTTRVSSAPVSGMADAVRSAVGDVNEVYQREADRADTAAYMEAQRKLGDWRNRWNDPNNEKGVQSFKGRDALRLGESMLPDYDSAVDEIANALPSQRARQKFMEYAGDTRLQVAGDINRYATAQNDAYVAGQRKAYIETQANDLIRAQLTNPDAYARKWAVTLDTIHADAAANGDSAEATALTVASLQSSVHAGVMDQLVSVDPIAAMDYYDEHADQFLEDHRARVLRVLEPLYADARAESDAAAALAGGSFHAPTRSAERVQADYARLAGKHGLTLTSTTRTPEQNAAAGGVANSQHLGGTAADFRTNGVPEPAIDAFIADARAAGYEVIDERKRTRGTGPHIHVELPPGRAAGEGPADEAAALERLGAIRDPRRRRAAEAKVRDRIEIDRLRRNEAERQTTEEINAAVWLADDPTRPLAEVLGPEQYAYAARKGWIDTLTNALKFRAEQKPRADVPEVVAPYLEAARSHPDAFARMDVMKNAQHMTEATAKTLVKLQEDVRAGKHDPAEAGTESEQLDALIFGPLGMVGQTAEAKKKRAPVEQAWYQMKADWTRANPGKPLDSTTRDGMLRRLRASFALRNTTGFEAFAMSPRDRAAIVEQFRARGIPNPSEQQIAHTYLIGVGQ